jgi:hypothetical protein
LFPFTRAVLAAGSMRATGIGAHQWRIGAAVCVEAGEDDEAVA